MAARAARTPAIAASRAGQSAALMTPPRNRSEWASQDAHSDRDGCRFLLCSEVPGRRSPQAPRVVAPAEQLPDQLTARARAHTGRLHEGLAVLGQALPLLPVGPALRSDALPRVVAGSAVGAAGQYGKRDEQPDAKEDDPEVHILTSASWSSCEACHGDPTRLRCMLHLHRSGVASAVQAAGAPPRVRWAI